MATVYIRDLIVEAKHGAHDYEKRTSQRFNISVELEVDIAQASQSDDLSDTIDWSMLRDVIVEVVQNNSFNLMERLAQVIADRLLEHGIIEKVTVSLEKLDAFPSGIPGVKLVASQK